MNKIYIGVNRELELPKGGYLVLDDEVTAPARAIFEPGECSFNPLEEVDYRKARDLAATFYALSPQGENTLTVRNGKRALVKLLLDAERLDDLGTPKDDAEREAVGMVEDVLVSPVLWGVLCGEGQKFRFSPDTKIVARVNRAELGDFDALALGLFLIGQAKGQVAIKDFGFYGREGHLSLIREERLIVGVNFLSELPEKLRSAVLLMQEKVGAGAIFEDAETLAKYARLEKGTNGWNSFVQHCVM